MNFQPDIAYPNAERMDPKPINERISDIKFQLDQLTLRAGDPDVAKTIKNLEEILNRELSQK